MTKKLLLRTAALTCALLLGLNTLAQVEFYPDQMRTVSKPVGYVDSKVRITTTDVQQTPMGANQTLKAPKAEGEMCTLRINLDYDRNQFKATYFIDVITDNGEGYRLFDFAMLGTFEQQVAAGTYHIICFFQSISPTATNRGAPIFVIKESVEITEDMTLTLSPEDANNHITLKNYGPDGELLKHDYGYANEAGETVILAEGNIENTTAFYDIILKGVGGITSLLLDIKQWVPTQEEQLGAGCDFYITDVSDRFLLTQTRICLGKTLAIENPPVWYISHFSTDNVKAGVLENTPANYVHQTETFKYSPYGKSQIGQGFGYQFIKAKNNNRYANDNLCRFYYELPKNGETYDIETWINLPDTDPIDNSYNFLFQTVAVDYGEVGQNAKVTGWITGTPMALKDGNLMKVNFGHHGTSMYVGAEYNYLYAFINDNKIVEQLLPAPEAFCYPAEQALGDYGDNCPINALQVSTYMANDQLNNSMMFYYVGLYGEVRWNNEGAYWAKHKFNGEEVDKETFATSGIGTRECTVINPNVEVDGLSGHNTTTVYYDQNQEDMTPPSIEMLHFKNNEGGVTDRFATAEEGTMEFYASDFHYHYYPELWRGVFECQPVEVVVEYAPYGTEDWNELTVEEIPEYYQEPGWGYFYRGSLAGVTGQGEKGWFDLRFRLQDASGNWMDQVVSPAFRIDDLAYSSVATIGSGDAHEVARYSIDGKRVDASHQGVTIIRMSDGTARKVLVK